MRIDPADAADVYRLATEHRLPVKSLLLAVHLAAWGEHGRNPEPVTGLVVNGRPEVPGADRMTGLFLNILPFRVPVNQSWPRFAQEVFETERAMLPYRPIFTGGDFRTRIPRPASRSRR